MRPPSEHGRGKSSLSIILYSDERERPVRKRTSRTRIRRLAACAEGGELSCLPQKLGSCLTAVSNKGSPVHCERSLVLHMFLFLSSPSRHMRHRQHVYASNSGIFSAVFCQSDLRWNLRKADIFSTEDGDQQPPTSPLLSRSNRLLEAFRSFINPSKGATDGFGTRTGIPDFQKVRTFFWKDRPSTEDCAAASYAANDLPRTKG